MTIYGLTGGSGAGKSEAARLLTAHGFGWVDADAVYRGLCVPGSALLAALDEAFGGVLTPEGALDRAKLAGKVFGDPEALARLDAITIPHIWKACRAEFDALAQAGVQRALFDAPTLFQTGLDRHCCAVIGVIAPRETRIARIIARDSLPPEAAAARIDAQPDAAFYRARCQYILENAGDRAALQAAVTALCSRLDAR